MTEPRDAEAPASAPAPSPIAELEDELRQHRPQAALLRLVAESSTALSGVASSADFDRVIAQILERWGVELGMDRAYLFQFSSDLELMSNTHEWCAPGIEPQADRIQNLPTASMPWWKERMLAYRIVHIPDVEQLPSEASAEQEEFRLQGIRSLLCLPTLSPRGGLTGFIGVDVVRRSYEWPASEVMLLRLLADAVGATLERRRAEDESARAKAALQQSEAKFLRLFDDDPHSMVVLEGERDGLFRVQAIHRAPQALPISPTLVGQVLDASVQALCQRCVAEARALSYDLDLDIPGVGKRSFHAILVPLVEAGRPPRIISSAVDVTERRQAERALEHERKLYHDLVSSVPAGVYRLHIAAQRAWGEAEWVERVGSNYRLEMVSDRYCELLGASREELERDASIVVARIHPEDRDDFVARNVVALQTQEIFVWEGRLAPEAGIRWAHMASVPRVLGNGDVLWTGILLDITARKEAELARQRAEDEQTRLMEQLHHAQKMEALGTLAGGVAHDFNNILAGVLGGLGLIELELGDHSDAVRTDLRELEELVQRGADLAKQLLGFSRRGKYDARPLDLASVVRKTSSMFGRTRRDISIQVDVASDLAHALVDHTQLEQVLLNLFLNAGQAMPNGGRMLLRAENVQLTSAEAHSAELGAGNYVRLVVADSGVGMDVATQARIFEPFFTTRPQGQGTGLGLASVYGIVKNHGGSIRVESELGKGSAFTLLLPAAAATEAVSASSPSPQVRGRGTLLVVDDEPIVLSTSARLLRASGYDVFAAASGIEAIAIARQQQLDLVLLDLTMPVLSGAETFERLRALQPGVKVLLMSGFSDDGQARKLLESGCNGFIHKPFALPDLLAKLRELGLS